VQKSIATIIKFILSIGLGVLLVWLSVRNLSPKDIAQMKDAFSRVNWMWLLVGPILGMLSNVVRALRWDMLLQSLGYKPKLLNVVAAIYVMYLGNVVFPRLGEISRCGIMFKTDGIPIEKSIGTMVLERFVDVLTLLVAGAILFFMEYDLLFGVFQQYIILPIQAKIGQSTFAAAGLYVAVLLIALAVFVWIYRNAEKNRLLLMIKEKVMGMLHGLVAVKDVSSPWLFIFYSILIWIMYFGMGYINFMILSETAHLGASAAIAILFFGTFAFIATQGGVGAYPLITREILLLYGVAANIGYAWGWISWTLQTIMVILAGLLAMGYLSFFAAKKVTS